MPIMQKISRLPVDNGARMGYKRRQRLRAVIGLRQDTTLRGLRVIQSDDGVNLTRPLRGQIGQHERSMNMDEQALVAAIEAASATLGAMALVIIHQEDPLALPEPPSQSDVTAYEGHMNTIKGQVPQEHHRFMDMSLRDYQGGFPDRAGAYLIEFLEGYMASSEYQGFSAESQNKVEFCLQDLREL